MVGNHDQVWSHSVDASWNILKRSFSWTLSLGRFDPKKNSAKPSTHLKSIYIGYDPKKIGDQLKQGKKGKSNQSFFSFWFSNVVAALNDPQPQNGHSSSADNGVLVSPTPIIHVKLISRLTLGFRCDALFRTFCPHCVSVMAVKPQTLHGNCELLYWFRRIRYG